MRNTNSNAAHNIKLIAMRAKTAKLNPAPNALHLIASGVVDQITMTVANAAGNDISELRKNILLPFRPDLRRMIGTIKKATDYFCGPLETAIANDA
jgi:hypothetical protein